MNSLAERREALVARCARERAELDAIVDGLGHKLALAEAVVTAARRVDRHRGLVGAAGMLMLVAPAAARTWIRSATWVVPLAVEGYRHFKDRRGREPDDLATDSGSER
ncbi:MAG TPA: hypothetical protein VFX92_14645 [Candidatus Krumholzibacteria bacterium]|nr:hypothetical protein [Candidatus Krumholzibacteria bacterium]